MQELLSPGQVKKLVFAILANGTLWFTRHAYEELDNDNLTEVDIVNTLRGGRVQPGELVAGTYRYRVETSQIAVVVAFRSETGRASSRRGGSSAERSGSIGCV